ncbi:hypothetical protein Ahy_B08g092995 [Arachis hypogaea]|uniref:CCHC-type domain-containing protein n=1 Tax=Arachis hypogaea TaxID=3818 RepID=A0A444Y547_ARAHY|nr:hypothetical protein Ahy_B08g092995 [Arachis hypogaea]
MAHEDDQCIEGAVIRLNPEYDHSFIEDNLNMVGKIISDKEVNFKTCKAALLGIWGNPDGVVISDVGRNKVLISFRDKNKGIQICKGGPWSIRGNLLNLQIWNGRQSVYDVDHNYMELWVQIHGLPLHFLTVKTAETIGKRLGVVTLNVTKPLPTDFWLARDNFHDIWVDLKYERIQDSYCLNCGVLGHNKRECTSPMATACWDSTKPRYAPGLGVNRAKVISARDTEQREDGIRELTDEKIETMKETWADDSFSGNRPGRGSQRTFKPYLEQQRIHDKESQGSREQIDEDSQNLSSRRVISEDKHSRFGERPATFINRMVKGKEKVHVAEEDSWDARQYDDGDQDHVQAK